MISSSRASGGLVKGPEQAKTRVVDEHVHLDRRGADLGPEVPSGVWLGEIDREHQRLDAVPGHEPTREGLELALPPSDQDQVPVVGRQLLGQLGPDALRGPRDQRVFPFRHSSLRSGPDATIDPSPEAIWQACNHPTSYSGAIDLW